MRAKRSRAVIVITTLRERFIGKIEFAAIESLRMLEHGKGALVDGPAMDLYARIIIGRLLAAQRFRRESERGRCRWKGCRCPGGG